MYKKTVTYVDYDGNQRTEDFYFNLNKAELLEMEMSVSGGLNNTVKRIISLKSEPEIMKIFKDLVLSAYGEKSADGRRFIKSQELREAFSQTEAYSQIFMELGSDDKEAAEFINHVIPADMVAEAEKAKAEAESANK